MKFLKELFISFLEAVKSSKEYRAKKYKL